MSSLFSGKIRRIALISVVAICLVISPLLVTRSSGYSPSYVTNNFAIVVPYVQNRTLSSPNAQTNGQFGGSVAVSGNIVVVGAPFENASGYSKAGHAYVFNTRTGDLIFNLTSPNAQTDGYFGYSVAIGGSIVVGAPNEASSGNQYAGNAYTFNVKTGKLISNLTSANPQYYGYFGYDVAISGNTVVVGAPNEASSGYSAAGNAYTFNVKTGKLIHTLTSPNAYIDGVFGRAVGISERTIVVGASGEWASGYNGAGHAYTFDAKTGKLMENYTSPNPQTYGYFGWDVAISGKIIVVGAPLENASGVKYSGHAYTFNAKNGALISNLSSPSPQYEGEFGISVAIGGKTVVVGAPGESSSGYSEAGNAFTFNALTGALIGTYTSANPQTDGVFGVSASITGNAKKIIVGAPDETADGYSNAGHAYVF